jgi:hypothetical protein
MFMSSKGDFRLSYVFNNNEICFLLCRLYISNYLLVNGISLDKTQECLNLNEIARIFSTLTKILGSIYIFMRKKSNRPLECVWMREYFEVM